MTRTCRAFLFALMVAMLLAPGAAFAQSGATARLQRLMNINLDPGTISDVVAAVRGATGLDVAIDPAIYLQSEAPVRMQLRNVKAGEVLRLAMDMVSQPSAPLELVIQDNLALITTAARADAGARVTKRYSVARLTGNRASEVEARTRTVASLVRQFIDPTGWSLVGGRTGELLIDGRDLEVTTTPVLHRKVEAFLTQLSSSLNPGAARNTSDLRFVNQRLEGEQQYGYGNRPAAEVISDLAIQRLRINLFTNWRVLGNLEITPETLVTIPQGAYTGADVLDRLAKALSHDGAEVVWMLDDESAIVHITGVEQQPGANHVIEIYDLSAHIKTSTDMAAHMQRIRSEIDREAWTGIGPGRNIMGDFDHLLIVSAAPTTQDRIAAMFNTKGK